MDKELKVRIKTELLKSGIKQMDLAQALGVSESLVSRVVNGHIKSSPDLRKGIADMLDVPEEALFGGCETCSGDCSCEK